MGFNDATTGSQRKGVQQGGVITEFHNIDPSNGVDSGFTVPSTLQKVLGWIGQGCFSAGCVSGSQCTQITNISLCAGPVLEISIADASDDTLDDENSRCVAIVWGW